MSSYEAMERRIAGREGAKEEKVREDEQRKVEQIQINPGG
jgi:hypothetical protein